jgi:hypothetical protein
MLSATDGATLGHGGHPGRRESLPRADWSGAGDGWRLWPLSRGDNDVFLDLFDREAHVTWTEALRGDGAGRLEATVRLMLAMLRHCRRFSSTTRPRLLMPSRFLGPGVVVLSRTQKLVVLDRLRGRVFQILNDDLTDAALLEREVEAAAALPSNTIPVLDANLDQPPFFVEQPYVPFRRTRGWRELVPHLGAVIEILWRYYESFGFERVSAHEYVTALFERLAPRLGTGDPATIAHRLMDRCLTELDRHPAMTIVLTRVHGDFIPAHVVWPRQPWPAEPLLIDWCESWRYSVAHDLFYLHFQTYDSDFYARLPSLGEADYASYLGAGYDTLRRLAADRLGDDLGLPAFRLQLLICFVEELEHRLTRLDRRFLAFWTQRTEPLLDAVDAAGGLS